MVRKIFGWFSVSILLIVAVAGCAGLPVKGGGGGAPSQAQAKLMETDRALDAANQQAAAFYAELNPVLEKIARLRSRPYWHEFEKILLEYPALRELESESQITPEMKARLSAWGLKWKTSWEQTLQDYLRLVDRCAILEAKRLSAREKLLSVQAGYLAVVIMEASAGREKKGEEIFSLANSLDKPGAELNSYRLDALGLYSSPD